MLGTININFKQLEIMKKQLKELQDLIIEKIKNEEYELVRAGFELNNLKVVFTLDEIEFKIHLIPYEGGILIVEHTGHGCLINESIAELLYSRHGEPIKKAEIQKQIEQLQKQLK